MENIDILQLYSKYNNVFLEKSPDLEIELHLFQTINPEKLEEINNYVNFLLKLEDMMNTHFTKQHLGSFYLNKYNEFYRNIITFFNEEFDEIPPLQ